MIEAQVETGAGTVPPGGVASAVAVVRQSDTVWRKWATRQPAQLGADVQDTGGCSRAACTNERPARPDNRSLDEKCCESEQGCEPDADKWAAGTTGRAR